MRPLASRSLPRRRFLTGTVAAGSGFVVLGLAACKGGSSGTASQRSVGLPTTAAGGPAPRRGGTLAVEWRATTSQWDPYRVNDSVLQHYGGIFEPLVRSNPKTLAVEPLLIASWEEVEAGLHYILHVRQGAVWENKAPTNGRVFDADDVVYNLKYASGLLDPSKAGQIVRSSSYRGLQSVTAIDKATVEMKLSTPNAAILPA